MRGGTRLARFRPHDWGDLVETAQARNATSVVVPMVTVGEGCFQKAAAASQNSLLGHGGSAQNSKCNTETTEQNATHGAVLLTPRSEPRRALTPIENLPW